VAIVGAFVCGKKIPEMMRGLGEGIRSFRKACTALQGRAVHASVTSLLPNLNPATEERE